MPIRLNASSCGASHLHAYNPFIVAATDSFMRAPEKFKGTNSSLVHTGDKRVSNPAYNDRQAEIIRPIPII